MVTFWNLSSDVIISIARQLMELKCTDEKTRFLLELLQQLMSRRNIFLKDHQASLLEILKQRSGQTAFVKFLLLFSLTNI